MTEESPQVAYRNAYEAWQRQLEEVHAVLLDGQALHPSKLKGLLNREATAKERYDEARRRLLGIPDPEDEA
jgi:hypothetical protein